MDLIAEQLVQSAAVCISFGAELQVVRHLQGLLIRRQFGNIFGREKARPAQTFAAPPIGIAGIDHRHFVSGPADGRKTNSIWVNWMRQQTIKYFKSSSSASRPLKLKRTTYRLVGRSLCVFCTKNNKQFRILNKIESRAKGTGEGHGEALAELCDFSLSSGSSTEFIRTLRRRLFCSWIGWTGLEGAKPKNDNPLATF